MIKVDTMSNTDKIIAKLKPGRMATISEMDDGSKVTVERSGKGDQLRFTRYSADSNSWHVFKVCAY